MSEYSATELDEMCDSCIHKVSKEDIDALIQQGREKGIDELTEAFDKWIKSTPQTAYYWTEFQVAFMKIAEQIKENKKG